VAKLKDAEAMAKDQRSISISEFFSKNAHLLGFDNPRKALLTTVKEAVDNSLDACEEAGILPDIEVSMLPVDDKEDRYIVTITDNGPGISEKNIARVFGKLLYGSKFHRLRMSRGQQGIGISAAGMYGMLTTGKPVKVITRPGKKKAAIYVELAMDTKKNEPIILKQKEVDWRPGTGTEVSIELKGSYKKGKQSVDEYLEQTAVANPHSEFTYINPEKTVRVFPRATKKLPPEAKEIKPHPYGIELGLLIKMLKETKQTSLSGFLQKEFSRVGPGVAKKIADNAKVSSRMKPIKVAHKEVEKIYDSIQVTKIMAPPTDCLAPIGVNQILSGMHKELGAEFYTAVTRRPSVYRGNPFAVEVGLAFGGKLPGDELARIMRFANRVPLLYQQSSCSIFKAVLETNWKSYSLTQPKGSLPHAPLVIMVHLASVWVPFTNEAKESIADYDVIRAEISLALKDCGRKLGIYVRKRQRAAKEAKRRDVFENYITEVCNSVGEISGKNTDTLLRKMTKMAKKITELANMLDEKESDISKLRKDKSIIIVDENVVDEGEEEQSDLFDEGRPAESKKKSGKSGKKKSKKKPRKR